jgi:hypothetical protein
MRGYTISGVYISSIYPDCERTKRTEKAGKVHFFVVKEFYIRKGSTGRL